MLNLRIGNSWRMLRRTMAHLLPALARVGPQPAWSQDEESPGRAGRVAEL